MSTVLVAVHDSTAAFEAAEAAIALAARLGARLCAVAVVDPDAAGGAAGVTRREHEADAALSHVLRAAEAAGVEASTSRRRGRIAREILAEARDVAADVVVMAIVDRPGHAIARVGSHTLRVLEHTEVPVLVVPPAG